MTILWSDTAGDGYANNRAIYTHPAGRVETGPRELYRDVFTTVTAVTYFSTIFLEKGYTVGNIGCYVATAAVTPTSSWLGLWSHPNPPPVRLATAGNTQPYANEPQPGTFTSVWTAIRTGTNTVPLITLTTTTVSSVVYNPVTWPISLTGRSITGTGIPASSWVRNQPSTTTLNLSANASSAGTNAITVGEFMTGGKYNIAFTTNGATGAIPIGAYARPVSGLAAVIPASGLYLLSCTFAATTMPVLVANTGNASIPLTFYNDAPMWSTSHVNGTTNNTAPGTNPFSSAGTTTDMRTQIYMYVTA